MFLENYMLNTQMIFLALALAVGGPHEQISVHRPVATIDSELGMFGAATQMSEITIRDGWLQEAPPSQKITAAYMVIENHGKADIALTRATSPVIDVIELHKMELSDGLMKMRRVESIKIPSVGEVELKLGGYHLMVIGLKQPLKEGDTVTISLEFNDGRRQSIEIPVRPRSAMMKERE